MNGRLSRKWEGMSGMFKKKVLCTIKTFLQDGCVYIKNNKAWASSVYVQGRWRETTKLSYSTLQGPNTELGTLGCFDVFSENSDACFAALPATSQSIVIVDAITIIFGPQTNPVNAAMRCRAFSCRFSPSLVQPWQNEPAKIPNKKWCERANSW